MNFRHIAFIALILLAGLASSAHAAAESSSAAPVLRLHWLGLDQVSTDTNAAQVMKIWHLPETTALVNQTLDKLSRWLADDGTNIAGKQIHPLLDDLLSSEFYLELQTPSSQTPDARPDFLLAVRLSPARAALWQTNLAAAFTALTGQKTKSAKTGWRLASAGHYGQIELARTNEWTVLAIGPEATHLLPQFTASLSPASRHPSHSNNWLEADVNLSRLAAALPSTLWGEAPRPSDGRGWREATGEGQPADEGGSSFRSQVSSFRFPVSGFQFQVSGTNGEVFTRATIALSHPWAEALPPWNLPTNLLDQTTASFTAIRGLSSWLAQLPAWQKTGLTPAPDQACFWSESGVPFQTYGLVPMPQASNQLAQLSARLIPGGNPWLATHAEGSFLWQPEVPGLQWKDAMLISPWAKADSVNHHDCLLGGLYGLQLGDTRPPPSGMLQPLRETPDLVYYQTEMTGSRIDEYFFITQLFRVVFHRAQLPPPAAGTQWLKHLEPLLGASTTQVVRHDPQTLALTRTSTIGFSALELHLLADWLESPKFPHGLHTFLAPPERQ